MQEQVSRDTTISIYEYIHWNLYRIPDVDRAFPQRIDLNCHQG